jgi:predicted HAD superfamily Cof-like phosphohydrolase
MPIRTKGEEFTQEEVELAKRLIQEEFTELKDSKNSTEKLDALVDLIYVALQYICVVGWDGEGYISNDYSLEDLVELITSKELVSTDYLFNLIDRCESKIEKMGINTYEAVKIVYESNMSKICTSEQEAIDSCNKYLPLETYYKKSDDSNFIIYRSSDNKVLKGINFKEPNLSKLFE